MKKKIREEFDSYLYKDDDDIHSSRQVKDLFKRELFHPTRDYSRQMKQAMAYTVEKNLHEKEKSKVKDTLKESENVNLYGFTYKNTVITDKFGNYWTMDTWVNGGSEPYASFDDAEASMLQCMEECGLPTAEDAPDAEDYAYEFTKFASTVVPNYIVGYEPTAVVSNDSDRVHSFAFDFIITDPTLGSAAEARDRILNEIELIEGIQIVGNPNVDPTSWSKEEYGLAESAKKDSKKLNEDATGKYSISWEKYERYGSGGVHTKNFSAKDDFDAILKIKEHEVGPIFGYGILVGDDEFYDEFDTESTSLKKVLADNDYEDFEEYKEDYNVFTSLDEILEHLTEDNGDGDDYIFYIKRPDGTYLFKDEGADADDDWDDDDDALEEELIEKGKYGIEVKDPRGLWVPASVNYPKNGKPVEFKKEDEAKSSDVYKALVDRYGKDKVRTYKQSKVKN